MANQAGYEGSVFDEQRLRRYAERVARELAHMGVATRGPAPLREVTETLRTGFLGLRSETHTHAEGGGEPQFWVVAARRESGNLTVNSPGSAWIGPHVWVRGDALLLTAEGQLLDSNFWWELAKNTEGRYPVFREIREATASAFLRYDYADKGRWKQQRALQGQQYAERYDRHYVLSAHAKGVGASVSLKRLLETRHQPVDVMEYYG